MKMTNEEKKSLIDLANEARRRAYVPYSNYPVGAALRTKTGRIYTGVNVENAAYPQTMCAERVAIFKAVSEGEMEFEVIAVVTNNGGSPCGGCRQVMAEYEMLSEKPIRIILQGNSEKIWIIDGIANLLPLMFHGGDLKK